jgi:hypothetical protein
MTNRAIAHARLRNSRLVGGPLPSATDVVRWFGAVQAQDIPGSLWAVAQRMTPTTMAQLASALDAGEFARTHALRPTWHYLVPAELRWIQALTGARVHRVNGTMYRRFGLDDEAFRRADAAFVGALRGRRALTRKELAAAVESTGIDLSDNLVITYLGLHAELEALITTGPRHGAQATFVLVDEWIPPAPARSRADALRELTIRYFQSHGPALVTDMTWWSGLTATSVREGIALAGSALEGRRVDDREYWAAAGALDPTPGLVPEPFVRLLSNYDEYLGSYADYSPIVDPSMPRARTVADILGAHIVIRDGFVVGGWRRALATDRATVTVTLLVPLSARERRALEAEVAAYGAFLGRPVELRLTEP